MNTYTKTCIICPHCGAKTGSSIDHLVSGAKFGPWYCDECGHGYGGVANGVETVLEKSEQRFDKTLDLLVLDPSDKPVFFVLAGKRFVDHADDDGGNTRYFYEEHSCPTNWIGEAVMIAVGGDTDPHGLLRYVRSVPATSDAHDDEIIAAFPEVAAGD